MTVARQPQHLPNVVVPNVGARFSASPSLLDPVGAQHAAPHLGKIINARTPLTCRVPHPSPLRVRFSPVHTLAPRSLPGEIFLLSVRPDHA
jgi:hypothetical protein